MKKKKKTGHKNIKQRKKRTQKHIPKEVLMEKAIKKYHEQCSPASLDEFLKMDG
jgi:hypothetical protein